MRYLALVLLLAACSSTTTVVAAPTANATDERICTAAEQPPWNSALITPLTRDPQTPIQAQARKTEDLFDAPGNVAQSIDEWHNLTQMCVDAGY